jgi:agmatinase
MKAPPLLRESIYSDSANGYAEWMGCNAHEVIAHDCGDLTKPTHKEIEKAIEEIFQRGHKPLTMGGDHSIAFPLLKAITKARGKSDKPLCIIQFDAHTDLYQTFEGNKYSHACPFTRIMEKELAQKLIQIGLRTVTPEHREQMERFGVQAIEMKDYPEHKKALVEYFKRHVPPDADIYISFDMDCMDPAFAPGVSHHEPGGMSVRQALDCIQLIPEGLDVIGADIVEYNPDRDINGVTSMVGAKIIKELVAKMHHNPVLPKPVYVKLRGLPFGCTAHQVLAFLEEHEKAALNVQIRSNNRNGNPEAVVRFKNLKAAEEACMARNFKYIGERYVEMFLQSDTRSSRE